jgi:hypothetical protein
MTAKGQPRIDLAKARVERRQAAEVAGDQRSDHGKEGEKSAAQDKWHSDNSPELAIPDADAEAERVLVPGTSAAIPREHVGAAPPGRSRVMPGTPPGEVQESDDEEERDVPNGADAPMAPMTEDPTDMYSPKSPEPEDESMSIGHLQALTVHEEDEDVQPATDVVSAHEELVKDVLETNVHILEILATLGANPKRYRRERSRAVKALVSEVYSAPRVTLAAKLLPGLGVLPGFALDLTTVNKQGHNWDFTQEAMRREAREIVETEEPTFLIGSPPCTQYCSWQLLNAQKFGWPEGEVERRMVAADVHLAFMAELYLIQMKGGRYFLHENPEGARSWERKSMAEIASDPRVNKVVGDQCQYGQQSSNGNPVRKSTGWMSNSPEILKKLERRCLGRRGD